MKKEDISLIDERGRDGEREGGGNSLLCRTTAQCALCSKMPYVSYNGPHI